MKYIMTAIAIMLVVYKIHIRLTANDEVDEAFSVLDQFDLNNVRAEV